MVCSKIPAVTSGWHSQAFAITSSLTSTYCRHIFQNHVWVWIIGNDSHTHTKKICFAIQTWPASVWDPIQIQPSLGVVLWVGASNIYRCRICILQNPNKQTKCWASCVVLGVGNDRNLFLSPMECPEWLLPRLFLRVVPLKQALGPLLDLSSSLCWSCASTTAFMSVPACPSVLILSCRV